MTRRHLCRYLTPGERRGQLSGLARGVRESLSR